MTRYTRLVMRGGNVWAALALTLAFGAAIVAANVMTTELGMVPVGFGLETMGPIATIRTSARSLAAWAVGIARGTPCPLGCGARSRGLMARASHLEVDHAGDPRPWSWFVRVGGRRNGRSAEAER